MKVELYNRLKVDGKGNVDNNLNFNKLKSFVEELESGKEIYEALLQDSPYSRGSALYFTDGMYVYPNGKIEHE